MKFVFILVSITMLSGCVVHPFHKGHKGTVIVPAKVMVILDGEHHDDGILVVQRKPQKKKKCWIHERHWHCKR